MFAACDEGFPAQRREHLEPLAASSRVVAGDLRSSRDGYADDSRRRCALLRLAEALAMGHHMLNPRSATTVAVTNPSLAQPVVELAQAGNHCRCPTRFLRTSTFRCSAPTSACRRGHPSDAGAAVERVARSSGLEDWLLRPTYLGNQTAHLWNGYELESGRLRFPASRPTANADARSRAEPSESGSRDGYHGPSG